MLYNDSRLHATVANSSNIALTVRTNCVCESSYRAKQTRETADCRQVAACENATLEIAFAATLLEVEACMWRSGGVFRNAQLRKRDQAETRSRCGW